MIGGATCELAESSEGIKRKKDEIKEKDDRKGQGGLMFALRVSFLVQIEYFFVFYRLNVVMSRGSLFAPLLLQILEYNFKSIQY